MTHNREKKRERNVQKESENDDTCHDVLPHTGDPDGEGSGCVRMRDERERI